MGLFDIFKSNKDETLISKTGYYVVNGKSLKPLDELPKTGSNNDIADNLGFKVFHSVHTFKSNKIKYVAFKRRTKEPIFLEVKNITDSLSYSDVTQIIQEIDWGFEWRQLDFEDNNK